MRLGQYATFALAFIALTLSAYFYPALPEQMATHWDMSGEVNGYSSKLLGSMLIPIMMVSFIILFKLLRSIDPLKPKWTMSEQWIDGFIVATLTFFLYIHVLVLALNLGYEINIGQFLSPPIGLLFASIGYILPKTDRNWFIGIRTPWTLSNDMVWQKTHRLGGKLFIVAGLATIFATAYPEVAFWTVIGSAATISLTLFIYSYLIFPK